MAKETYSIHMAKEAYSYTGIPEEQIEVKRDLFMCQKRPIHMCQKRPIHMSKEAYSYTSIPEEQIWQKRPIHTRAYLRSRSTTPCRPKNAAACSAV